MLCVSGTREQLSPHHLASVGRYRHQVFVNHLRWPLNSFNGMELDEFDSPEAVYVSSHDGRGRLNGVARLLPTTAPYLLEKVFPALWSHESLPHDPTVWELSRFAALDFGVDKAITHQSPAKHAASFFRQAVKIAKQRGARKLITVSPVSMERLLRVNGFSAERAGNVAIHHGSPIVALMLHTEHIEI